MKRCRVVTYLLLFCMGVLTSCREMEVVTDSDFYDQSCIRVIYPVTGLGDRSYVDCIYRGICLCEEYLPAFAVENYCPNTMEEAEGAMGDWFEPTASGKFRNRLLILTNDSYTALLLAHPEWTIPDGDAVLLLDHNGALPAPWQDVYTRLVCCYGASYEAARLIKELGGERTAIVMANPLIQAPQEIKQGFVDGFRAGGGTFDDEADTYYLGQGIDEGFDQADSLYRLCATLATEKRYAFVLPVCGGSIQGALRYTRDYPGSFYTCGIDVDMQSYSTKVAFSIMKHMDSLIVDFLDHWLSGEAQEHDKIYEVDSPYAELHISERFLAEHPNALEILQSYQDDAVTVGLGFYKR